MSGETSSFESILAFNSQSWSQASQVLSPLNIAILLYSARFVSLDEYAIDPTLHLYELSTSQVRVENGLESPE